MGTARERKVVIVASDGMQLLDIIGPADLFGVATRLLPAGNGYRVVIASPHAAPIRGSAGQRLLADTTLTQVRPATADTVLVGGGMEFEQTLREPLIVPSLQRLASGARRMCSVCTGAFLLADAGLLDHRSATTHWAFCVELARRYPLVRVEPDRIFIRDGAIATSAGVTAGMDLALGLIEEDHGPEVARAVARWTVMFLQRPGGQSQFSERLALPAGVSVPIRRLLDDIVAEPAADHSQAQLALRASLSERHLRRLFAEQTSTTPGRFVERVRVEAARDLLEGGEMPIGTIARRCGFGSPETMRRAFLRVLGVGPDGYRSRFRSARPWAFDGAPYITAM
jgi:transcriptional regulator GlxA family with amidase domain